MPAEAKDRKQNLALFRALEIDKAVGVAFSATNWANGETSDPRAG
jgi:hypothetical protein